MTAPAAMKSCHEKDEIWPPVGDPSASLGAESITASTSENISPSATPSSAGKGTFFPTGTEITTDPLAHPESSASNDRDVIDGVGIVELYASLKQGQSVKQWYLQHSRELANIDIRRFITFGIIKGFLYRVHKYAIATGNPAPQFKSGATTPRSHYHSGPSSRGPGTGTNSPYASSAGDEPAPIAQHHPHHHRSHQQHQNHRGDDRSSVHSGSRSAVYYEDDDEDDFIDDHDLAKYLDGMHCFDQICTDLEISERELAARLKRYQGEVLILHR